MSINAFISSQSYVFGIITFLLGLILGNRLAIGRDRRKEFNFATHDIYIRLIDQINAINIGYIDDEITGFKYIRHHIPFYKRCIFDSRTTKYKAAYYKYRESCSYDTKSGTVYDDKSLIQNIKPCVESLLLCFKRK